MALNIKRFDYLQKFIVSPEGQEMPSPPTLRMGKRKNSVHSEVLAEWEIEFKVQRVLVM